MSLADELNALTKNVELRVLIIDVERLPGKAEVPFWSLGDYKHRRIHYEHVTEWPRTICAAWRWFGEAKIHFAAEWEPGGAYGFAEKVRDALDGADIVSGHNANRADRRWLNSTFRDHGLQFPSPYRVADTLTTARRELGDESLTLGALTQRYGIPTKQGRYDADVARAACDGNKKAQREIKTYNMADVEASTGLFAALLPLFKGLPHMAPNRAAEQNVCPRCGSDDVHRRGTHSPAVFIYKRYLCNNCTGWYRTTYEAKGPSTKAV